MSIAAVSMFAGLPSPGYAAAAARFQLQSTAFDVAFDPVRGGFTTLKRPGDLVLEFLAPAGHAPAASRLGDVGLQYRPAAQEWKSAGSWVGVSTQDAGMTPQVSAKEGEHAVTFAYTDIRPRSRGAAVPAITETVQEVDDGLHWEIIVRNLAPEAIELGGVSFPLPFNENFRRERDPAVTYTHYVLRHELIGGQNSYIYWMRADGVAPFLVMTPGVGTELEYYDRNNEEDEGVFTVYAHALAQARDILPNGTWRQPLSEAVLAPAGQPGDRATYSFDLHWADGYPALRERLAKQGMLDVETAPGMVIPLNLDAQISLRSNTPIDNLQAEYPAETDIASLSSPASGRQLYRIQFHHLGENEVIVRWGGKTTRLEYFVTEPLRTLVEKRAAFLVDHQQVRDPSKWYDGVFSLWDMKEMRLRTPDDTGGLDGFMVGGSDDPDLSKAPMIAEKNVRYPNDSQIAALEYYATHFVWGKLQRTADEAPYPYGVYGVLNWKADRESPQDSQGHGRQKMWRSYDYPHLIQFYLLMYQIGRLYPEKLHQLTALEYLKRADGTAQAYFKVPYSITMDPRTGFPGYNDWSYKLGAMHESHIVELIEALDAEGLHRDAGSIRSEWEKKVKYFTYDSAYPFGSEMFFDTTAFQSTHALARYGLTHPIGPDQNLWQDKNTARWYSHPSVNPADFADLMRRSLQADIAARGWVDTSYYQLGSDYRGSSLRGFLTYMSQMGGAPILDYGLNFALKDAPAYIRLGYASQLSAWSLMNTGVAASGYGYWHAGKADDGAAGWAFLPLKWAVSVYGTNIEQGRGAWRYDGEIDNGFSEAIASASTVVVRDPMFGLVALGGTVEASGGTYHIGCRDEAAQKLYIRDGPRSFDLTLDRDGFDPRSTVDVALAGDRVGFTLENRSGDDHSTRVTLRGLSAGYYKLEGAGNGRVFTSEIIDKEVVLKVLVSADAATIPIRIGRVRESHP